MKNENLKIERKTLIDMIDLLHNQIKYDILKERQKSELVYEVFDEAFVGTYADEMDGLFCDTDEITMSKSRTIENHTIRLTLRTLVKTLALQDKKVGYWIASENDLVHTVVKEKAELDDIDVKRLLFWQWETDGTKLSFEEVMNNFYKYMEEQPEIKCAYDNMVEQIDEYEEYIEEMFEETFLV